MKKAQKRKSSLFASLCLLVAALGLAENRAWGFFVPTGPASLLIYEVVEDDGTTVAARYDYDPFGRVEKLSGSYDVDFLYTGHLHHLPSGLYLTHYRAYDPDTGVWLSRDPQDYIDGPNPYAYVLNNPINSIDPTGEALLLIIFVVFEIGSTAYDVYYMLTTVLDDCASEEEKANAVAGAAMGLGLPGGGYGRILNFSKNIPTKASDTLRHIKNTGNPPHRHKGGKTFENDGRQGAQVLPREDASGNPISYKEYDVNPKQKGRKRGTERVVVGSDGKAYYTDDHYHTFTPIE